MALLSPAFMRALPRPHPQRPPVAAAGVPRRCTRSSRRSTTASRSSASRCTSSTRASTPGRSCCRAPSSCRTRRTPARCSPRCARSSTRCCPRRCGCWPPGRVRRDPRAAAAARSSAAASRSAGALGARGLVLVVAGRRPRSGLVGLGHVLAHGPLGLVDVLVEVVEALRRAAPRCAAALRSASVSGRSMPGRASRARPGVYPRGHRRADLHRARRRR